MSVLGSWLASRPPDAAVEIAPTRVSAAVVSYRAEGVAVSAHAVEALPPGLIVPSLTSTNITDGAAVADALRRVFDALGMRPRRVALVIPDSAAKISLLRFDQVPDRREDLDQLVRWQMRKSSPFPIDDASVSYSPGLQSPDGGREFVVEIARREVVREYEMVCDAAGAYAGLVDLATVSLVNLFLASVTSLSEDWLLVHVRPEYTSIVIMRGPDLIFFRNRPEGDNDGLADIVHQTVMYYQDRLTGQGFARVLVAGAGRSADSVDAARRGLEDRLGLPVELVDPTRAAPLTDRIKASRELMDVLGPLLGMLLRTRREAVGA
jgi:type IV pilus assembly protein PilM